MIKLHSDNNPVWINVDHIQLIQDCKDGKYKTSIQLITMVQLVDESMGTVMELLDG